MNPHQQIIYKVEYRNIHSFGLWVLGPGANNPLSIIALTSAKNLYLLAFGMRNGPPMITQLESCSDGSWCLNLGQLAQQEGLRPRRDCLCSASSPRRRIHHLLANHLVPLTFFFKKSFGSFLRQGLSLCSPGWLGTHCAAKASFALTIIVLTQFSKCWDYRVCAITPSLSLIYSKGC